MALDSVAQVEAVYRYVGKQGISNDLISRGDESGSFFHYTDYNAFASIVTKKDLWLPTQAFLTMGGTGKWPFVDRIGGKGSSRRWKNARSTLARNRRRQVRSRSEGPRNSDARGVRVLFL
jgi:hypothetical protein